MRRAGPTLLLDLDGTLTDPHDGIVGSLRHALVGLGVPPPSDAALACRIGPPLSETFAEILDVEKDSERVKAAIDLYRERFGASGWRENRVYPAIPEFLDAARDAGYACFIATSKPGVFAERIASHFDLRRRLDGVHGSELDGQRSAKPELLAHIVAVRALDPARTVMVGDRRHDVAGAHANGIASVGVLWGYGDRAELEDAGAHALCGQPGELLAAADALLSSSGAS